ncbi:MAG TPA: FtsX-like permease family protein [Halanaerobiaceae bacterium]|jgi:putative ABC transport system permease protein|nr:ABC transporter permease [Bacillota bacterium]HHU91841.1 FtsX-like permease family protein [Halanaerobiaceae bacterium]HOA41412.1 ABC transporter permease [Halanaerobiales bacterium]HPZ63532.1 ABC transporter permease [Halanaerobiales bacterium]HQD04772.1 ABC transporter permease [Halanaerobiales bacterium]
MVFLERIKISLTGVWSNKFRSFLTLLGIIIGVSSVIIMVSLGSGTQRVIGGQFDELFSRQVYLTKNWDLPYRYAVDLSLEDVDYLKESIIGIEDVVPFFRNWCDIIYEGREYFGGVAGVVEKAPDLTNLKLEYGRMISEEDLINHERAAVVGQRILEQLSDNSDFTSFLGKEIKLDGHKMMVVGVLGMSGSTAYLTNDVVLIPYTTYLDIWRSDWQSSPEFFLLAYDSTTREQDIIKQAEFLLNQKYGTYKGKSKFLMSGMESEINFINNVIEIMTLVLGGIAAISLLVGGVGVMNIMLVTVKERTREIGVRKAIGASSRDIQSQFLLEAIILAGGGGLIGILVGVGISSIISFILSMSYNWWQGGTPFWVIFLAFAVTTMIGIIFGFYPAFKASRLDPIEALRYE